MNSSCTQPQNEPTSRPWSKLRSIARSLLMSFLLPVVVATATVLGIVFAITAVVSTKLEHRKANANRWAAQMKISDPVVVCDESDVACGCTVKYVDDQRVVHFLGIECCGSGCELRGNHK